MGGEKTITLTTAPETDTSLENILVEGYEIKYSNDFQDLIISDADDGTFIVSTISRMRSKWGDRKLSSSRIILPLLGKVKPSVICGK